METDTVKHAPGPWQTMNSHKAGFQDIWSLGDDQPQNRKVVCEVGPSDTKWGDAFLIAAAPDLLNALELAIATINRLEQRRPTGSVKGTLDVCREAIAKAEGCLTGWQS